MKKLVLLFILSTIFTFAYSQTPQKFNYQGVARTSAGAVIPDQAIGLRVVILNNSPSGNILYAETHTPTTNQLGLFTVSIGAGTPVNGNFSAIPWGDGDKYLSIQIDPEGGTNYTLAGTFQLLSVPYALQSRNAERLQGYPVSITPPLDAQVLVWDAGAGEWVPADAAQSIVYTAGAGININAGNVISNTAPDQTVAINGTGATTVTGAYPNFTVNTPLPSDNSPTNELQTLSLAGSNLTLSNGGGTVTLPPEVDGSVTNELQTISLNGNTLSLSNGGGSVTLNNGVNYTPGFGIDITGGVISNTGDGDDNPSNEIQTLSLDGNTLSLSNGGGSVTLNNGVNYNAGTGIDIAGNVISNTGDLSTTNELQTLSLNGTTLSLSNGGGSVEIPEAPIYTAGAGIAIDGNNEISNTGDLDGSDDITTAIPAGGDLEGFYPNPTVVGLYGNPISADPPAIGFVLQWDGNAWVPTNPGTQSGAWLLTGNGGIDSLTNFIGTIDEAPLQFRVHNIPAGRISYWDGNTFMGLQAGLNTAGALNTAFGTQALIFNTDGSANTATGFQALAFNSIGEGNTATGFNSLGSNTEGGYNSAFGLQALFSNEIGDYNTGVGTDALFSNTEGNYNTATGMQSLYNNTLGEANSALGVQALYDNTEGNYNTAVGVLALSSNTTGSDNTAVGEEALNSNTTGESNTSTGVLSLYSNIDGHDNVATGFQTLFGNESGSFNTAAGNTSLAFNTAGNYNTANGFQALAYTTGSNNTGFGANTLFTNSTGSNNTAIGSGANVSVGTLSNASAIGYMATVNANNKIRLGNAAVTVIEGQVAWSFPSDARFKFNVTDAVKGLDFIKRLRPVNYQFDTEKYADFLNRNVSEEMSKDLEDMDYSESSGVIHTGFIAQEVEKAARESGFNFDGVHVPVDGNDNYSVAYSQFVVPLVKAVQEQQEMIEAQNEEIAKLKAELEEIKALLKAK